MCEEWRGVGIGWRSLRSVTGELERRESGTFQ